MSDFKVRMHQIVCRLGLCPRPRWGSLQRSPRPLSWILGGLLLRGRDGKGKGGKKRGRRERGRDGEGTRQGRPPKLKLGPTKTIFLASALGELLETLGCGSFLLHAGCLTSIWQRQ